MKNSLQISALILMFLLSGMIESLAPLFAQNDGKLKVYVWDFSVSDESLDEFGAWFTDDFETELINLGKYDVLDRRRYDRIKLHQEMENQIIDMENLPTASKDSLKAIMAEAVFFGTLKYDEGSGQYQVTVALQKLNVAQNLKKDEVVFTKGKIHDNENRKVLMRELLNRLHSKEILTAKKEQYDLISGLLNSYLASIKDIRIAFEGVADFALADLEYYKELEQIINNYNVIWRDLNSNREKYIMDFEASLGQPFASEFENIYAKIMDNIHKTEILPLNKVREDIWNYRESKASKSQKERMKRKIMENNDKMVRDLQEEIVELEYEIVKFLNDIKNKI